MYTLTLDPKNDSLWSMSLRLKQLTVSALVTLFRLSHAILSMVWWLVTMVVYPILFLAKTAIKPVVLWAYRWYVTAYTKLKRSLFLQNKILFIFGHKYFIHVTVIIIALFVTTTNLNAQEYNGDEFGKHSALYKIVQENSEEITTEDIVEQGLPQRPSTGQRYINNSGTVALDSTNINPSAKTTSALGENQASTTAANATFVSNTMLQTKGGIRADIVNYTVKTGESIGTIANRFGISAQTILWANGLSDTSIIKAGDVLKVPPVSGYTYQIATGDTLQKVVEKYHGDLEATMKLNGISDDQTVAVGSQIVVIGGAPPAPAPTPIKNSYLANSDTRYSSGNSGSGVNVNRNVPARVTGGTFNWPLACHSAMTTYWGHAGRGRDISCGVGQPIYAATDGVARISFTGAWGHGYGNAIDISGPGGVMTRYAHMSAFNVSNGQRVSRGQVIGFVGMTGRTSGPHLHFEIHINGVAYDPINYLR